MSYLKNQNFSWPLQVWELVMPNTTWNWWMRCAVGTIPSWMVVGIYPSWNLCEVWVFGNLVKTTRTDAAWTKLYQGSLGYDVATSGNRMIWSVVDNPWVGLTWKYIYLDEDRVLTQADILALWFSTWGNSGWPVDWLDWIAVRAWTSDQYRANYRWETIWSWAVWGWYWIWYDPQTKRIFIYNTNGAGIQHITKYNISGTALLSTWGIWYDWGIMKWSTINRKIYMQNRIIYNMDSGAISTLGTFWSFCDVSPSGQTLVTVRNNFSSSVSNNGIPAATYLLDIWNDWPSVWPTLRLTLTYTNTFYPSNNSFIGATLIDDDTIAVYHADWSNGNISYVIRRITISTGIVTHSSWQWSVNDQPQTWIQYSPLDNKIYITRYTNTWFSNYTCVYKMNIDLTNMQWVANTSAEMPNYIYRCSDWSIATQINTAWWNNRTNQLVYNASNKYWNQILSGNFWSNGQLAVIF